jgi:homoserine kinase type II
MTVPRSATELLARWGIGATATMSAQQGTNNHTFAVASGGQRWALRISSSLRGAQVEAEHRLLARLRQADLPFGVPEPVPTLDGATWVQTPGGPATLCRWLPGVRPGRRRAAALTPFGRAIGVLDSALARVPARDAPMDWPDDPLDVHAGQRGIGDLGRALEAAGASRGHLRALTATALSVRARWPGLRRSLPAQVIHNDLAWSNTLVDEHSGEVTAVLDFELAGVNVRVADFMVGLLHSGSLEGPDWPQRATALASGVCSVLELTPAELEALPDLLRCRTLQSLLWRAGRWRRGLATAGEVAERLDRLADFEHWLRGHAGELRSVLAAAQAAARPERTRPRPDGPRGS